MSATVANTSLRLAVSAFFRTIWPDHTSKHAARALGLSHRTTEGWVQARRLPSGPAWTAMYRITQENEAARAAAVDLARKGAALLAQLAETDRRSEKRIARLLRVAEMTIEEMATPALASDLLVAGDDLAASGEPSDATPARHRPQVRAGP